MFKILILMIILSPTSHALSNKEQTAINDAKVTLAEYKKLVSELISKSTNSLTKFSHESFFLSSKLDAYCNSLKHYKSIYSDCSATFKNATNALNTHKDFLAKTLKEDLYGDIESKILIFRQTAIDLRTTKENSEVIKPDKLHIERIKLENEMQEFCPTVQITELSQICNSILKNSSFDLKSYEELLRKPEQYVKTSKNHSIKTSPRLRCFVDLPKGIKDFDVTDPSGKYRYSDLAKTQFGYAVDISLKDLNKKIKTNDFSIAKNIIIKNHNNTYSFSIAAIQNYNEINAKRIAINLSSTDINGKKFSSKSIFPLTNDVILDAQISLDDDDIDSFGLSCVVASKFRNSYLIYSDDVFMEE